MGAYLCIAKNGIPPSVSKRIMLRVTCEYFQLPDCVITCLLFIFSTTRYARQTLLLHLMWYIYTFIISFMSSCLSLQLLSTTFVTQLYSFFFYFPMHFLYLIFSHILPLLSINLFLHTQNFFGATWACYLKGKTSTQYKFYFGMISTQ